MRNMISYILALGKGPNDEVLVIKCETWIANTLCNSMGIFENGTTNNGKDARRKWVGMKFIKLLCDMMKHASPYKRWGKYLQLVTMWKRSILKRSWTNSCKLKFVFQGIVSAQETIEKFTGMKPSKMMCGKMRLASCHIDHKWVYEIFKTCNDFF